MENKIFIISYKETKYGLTKMIYTDTREKMNKYYDFLLSHNKHDVTINRADCLDDSLMQEYKKYELVITFKFDVNKISFESHSLEEKVQSKPITKTAISGRVHRHRTYNLDYNKYTCVFWIYPNIHDNLDIDGDLIRIDIEDEIVRRWNGIVQYINIYNRCERLDDICCTIVDKINKEWKL